MRRVLIVTSSYAPTMIADMHRARHLAWELPELGWEVEILSPDVSYQVQSYLDESSDIFFPPDTPTHLVSERWSSLFKATGIRAIGWRALLPMLNAGIKLFKGQNFDLVYISTAKFPLFLLGPVWRKWMGVPYVLDFHDPCYRGEAASPIRSPRNFKHIIARWLSKHIESLATPAAAGLVSVSPDYIDMVRQRYGSRKPVWLNAGRQAVIPFAALPRDFNQGVDRVKHSETPRFAKIIYVGVGGSVMARSFSVLCSALGHLRSEHGALVDSIRFELYGTMLGWKEGDPRELVEIAREHSVDDLVSEYPMRVSYQRSLELLLESNGALILGANDDGYMPSKLYSYALSGKPLLASLRRDGPAFTQFKNMPGLGHALWFADLQEMPVAEATNVVKHFLDEVTSRHSFDRRVMLAPFLASAMALQHVELFEACLQRSS
jgi:hypothetical protein